MKLSIIIPVYKVRDYIAQCLESIESQPLDKSFYEVIIINDGTPDDSMDVAAPVIARMSNARVINQNNQGLSMARNNGFDAAKGEYIWFVDSDDTLLPNALNDVLEAINNRKNIDIVATVLQCKRESTGVEFLEYNANYIVDTGRDYMFSGNNKGAIQRFIIRRQYLLDNNIMFMPGVYHEDGAYSHKLLYPAKSLYVLPEPVYCYLLRSQGSIMSTRNPKANYDLVKIYRELIEYCQRNVSKEDEWRFRASIAECLYCSIEFSRKEIFTDEFNAFYQDHKQLLHDTTRKLLEHHSALTLKEVVRALHYYLAPLWWTKTKQAIKRMLLCVK